MLFYNLFECESHYPLKYQWFLSAFWFFGKSFVSILGITNLIMICVSFIKGQQYRFIWNFYLIINAEYHFLHSNNMVVFPQIIDLLFKQINIQAFDIKISCVFLDHADSDTWQLLNYSYIGPIRMKGINHSNIIF